MTLSELREMARRRGVQVDEGLLELLAEILSERSSEFDRLWSRIDTQLKQGWAFQEKYFLLVKEGMEKRFEEMDKRFEVVLQVLAEQRAEANKRFAEQRAEMDRRFVEQKAE
ncbi:MAG: hypothetical protein N2200_05545, partial [Bacteroidia bacterium]|nr:hypothetical protein [Bacteroidia bacterium]